jgi:hypothetical protein
MQLRSLGSTPVVSKQQAPTRDDTLSFMSQAFMSFRASHSPSAKAKGPIALR